MEDRTRRAVSLILEDGIESHTRHLGEELAVHDGKKAFDRTENERRAKEMGYLSAGHIESGSRYWVNLASIFRQHSERCISQLGDSLRQLTSDNQAGEMFRLEVTRFLDKLDEQYEKRLKNQRPIVQIPNGYEQFWLRERDGLARKIEIEICKFDAYSNGLAVLIPGATPALVRDKPYADEVAMLIRSRSGIDVAKAIRKVLYLDHTRTEQSVERGIRNCFDTHYHKNGQPKLH